MTVPAIADSTGSGSPPHPCADCYHFEERAGEQVCRAPEPSEFPLIVDEDCPDYLPVIRVPLEAAP